MNELSEWAILGNEKTTKIHTCNFCGFAIPKRSEVAIRISDNAIAHITCAFPKSDEAEA